MVFLISFVRQSLVWADPQSAQNVCLISPCFKNCMHKMPEAHMRCFGEEFLRTPCVKMYRFRSLLEAWALETVVAQISGSADKARLCVETKTFQR